MDRSARSISSRTASASYRMSALRFSSFCRLTSRIPARNLVVSARSERSALDSRCSAMSSSSLVAFPPLRRCHNSRVALARFCDSRSIACKSKPPSTPVGSAGAPPSADERCSSTASGSSRALEMTRRSLGTDCATADTSSLRTRAYRGATAASRSSALR
eukprot:scaffold28754_cov30-Tisochrysis_lutea.AAC.3